MQMKINEIIVKRRIRKDLGDLSQLTTSISKNGLLNPILVTKNKELIAGERRLESAKKLGWQTIDIRIMDTFSESKKLEMELDENIYRRNLSSDELADGYIRLDKLAHPGFLKKLWTIIINFFKRLFRIGR